jgi:hypothetical protein
MSKFDPEINIAGTNMFLGEFTAVTVSQAPAVPGYVGSGNRVIDPTKPFTIDLAWQVTGIDVPLRMNAVGDWNVYAYAESIGPGPEAALTLTPQVVPKGVLKPGAMSWTHTVTVNPGILTENTGSGSSGLYKIGLVVFANSNLPTPGNDVIGFTDARTILVENPI